MDKRRNYFPQLDGVRFLCLLAIILYHYFPNQLSGGFLAVDLFLILSGFLLANQLTVYEEDTISFGRLISHFFKRLGKLLKPLLLFLVVSLISLALFRRDLLTNVRSSVLSSLFFGNNWEQIWQGKSYFSNFLNPSIYTHLWYLGVYAQSVLLFYGVYAFVKKRTNQTQVLRMVLIGISLLSAILMAVYFQAGQDPTRVYYGTDTRLFSFFLGAFGGIGIPKSWRRFRSRFSWTKNLDFFLVGIEIILFLAMKFLTDASPLAYYGGMFLWDLFALWFILGLTIRPSFISKLFSFSPLVWLGQRTYPMYLWYYPIYILCSESASENSWIGKHIFLQILFILVLGIGSQRLLQGPTFEVPIFFRKKGEPLHFKTSMKRMCQSTAPLRQRFVFWLCMGSVVLATGILFLAPTSDLAQESDRLMKQKAQQLNVQNKKELVNNKEEVEKYKNELTADQSRLLEHFSDEEFLQANGKAFTFLGDSLTIDVASGVTALFPQSNVCAKVGLQVWQAPSLLEEFKGKESIHEDLVVALGSNGTFTEKQMKHLLEMTQAKKVYFVTTHINRPWREKVNGDLKKMCDESQGKYRLIDWSSYYQSHATADWLAPDKFHFVEPGIQAWIDFVGHALLEDKVNNS